MTATARSISDPTRSFLSREHGLFIDGRWIEAGTSKRLSVRNPATGDVIAVIHEASAPDVDRAVTAARRALEGDWSQIGAQARGELLHRLAGLIEREAERLAELETLENGMPLSLSLNTLRSFCVPFIRYYAGWPTKIVGDTLPIRPSWAPPGDWLIYTLREPIGVVAAIIPWNAPCAMMVLKLAPALAAGCTLVLKPAELTPLVATRIAQLVEEAGFPRGVVNLVQGVGETVGRALVRHPAVNKIAFTGSTEVGKAIVREAANDLKRVTLELGGKSPFVVFPDADLDEAAPAAAMACFMFAGQACMAGTRLFVAEPIYDRFVAKVVDFSAQLKLGDGFDPTTTIGPLISAAQRSRVQSFVDRAKRQGISVACGGSAVGDKGFFYSPTVCVGVEPDTELAQTEVFGPVMAAIRFDIDDEAALVRAINSTPYGLAGSVWTQNLSRAHRLAARIDSGQVGVNVHAAISPETPFGGNKQSGWGREYGSEGLDAYLKTKAVSVRIAGPASTASLG